MTHDNKSLVKLLRDGWRGDTATDLMREAADRISEMTAAYDENLWRIARAIDHQANAQMPGSDIFDRWIAEHDRLVAERAWEEGFSRGFYAGQSYPYGADASEPDIDNPYRKEQENNDA